MPSRTHPQREKSVSSLRCPRFVFLFARLIHLSGLQPPRIRRGAPLNPSLDVQHQAAWVFDAFLDTDQEAHRLLTIHNTVIIR